MIYEFVTFINTRRFKYFDPADKTRKEFVLELDEIGAKMKTKFQFGVINKAETTIVHPDYSVMYTRTWPDWNTRIKMDRLSGNHDFHWGGNMEVLKQHLLFMKLSTAS